MRRARAEIDLHLAAMGTKASTSKGKSHEGGRRRLKKKKMQDKGRAVLFHWRDLGAHANVARTSWGPTLTKRMAEAARMAGPLRALPGGQDSRARLVRS